MRTIICKRCGARIDADKGECPVCGAVYYILPDDPASVPDDTKIWEGGDAKKRADAGLTDDTRELPGSDAVLGGMAGGFAPRGQTRETDSAPRYTQERTPPARNPGTPPPSGVNPRTREIQTHDPRPREPRPASPPGYRGGDDYARRSGGRPPASRDGRNAPERDMRHPRERMDVRYPPQDGRHSGGPRPPDGGRHGTRKRNIIIISACVLFVVLTLVICIMSGVFDFNKKDDKMPDVIGLSRDSAVSMLERLGLELDITFTTKESDRPEDEVIEQSVREGRTVRRGDTVLLTLSEGGEDEADAEIIIPNLIGYTFAEARTMAENLGLNLVRQAEDVNAAPAGEIYWQNPSEGKAVKEGGTVYVSISKGPEETPPPTPSPSPTPASHTITVTAGKGGSVSPKGLVSVSEGQSQSFSITPDAGYEVSEVKVDGVSVGAVTSYSFTDVRANHTLYAVFKIKPEPTPSPTPNPPPATEEPIVTPPAAE